MDLGEILDDKPPPSAAQDNQDGEFEKMWEFEFDAANIKLDISCEEEQICEVPIVADLKADLKATSTAEALNEIQDNEPTEVSVNASIKEEIQTEEDECVEEVISEDDDETNKSLIDSLMGNCSFNSEMNEPIKEKSKDDYNPEICLVMSDHNYPRCSQESQSPPNLKETLFNHILSQSQEAKTTETNINKEKINEYVDSLLANLNQFSKSYLGVTEKQNVDATVNQEKKDDSVQNDDTGSEANFSVQDLMDEILADDDTQQEIKKPDPEKTEKDLQEEDIMKLEQEIQRTLESMDNSSASSSSSDEEKQIKTEPVEESNTEEQTTEIEVSKEKTIENSITPTMDMPEIETQVSKTAEEMAETRSIENQSPTEHLNEDDAISDTEMQAPKSAEDNLSDKNKEEAAISDTEMEPTKSAEEGLSEKNKSSPNSPAANNDLLAASHETLFPNNTEVMSALLDENCSEPLEHLNEPFELMALNVTEESHNAKVKETLQNITKFANKLLCDCQSFASASRNIEEKLEKYLTEQFEEFRLLSNYQQRLKESSQQTDMIKKLSKKQKLRKLNKKNKKLLLASSDSSTDFQSSDEISDEDLSATASAIKEESSNLCTTNTEDMANNLLANVAEVLKENVTIKTETPTEATAAAVLKNTISSSSNRLLPAEYDDGICLDPYIESEIFETGPITEQPEKSQLLNNKLSQISAKKFLGKKLNKKLKKSNESDKENKKDIKNKTDDSGDSSSDSEKDKEIERYVEKILTCKI